MKKQLIRFVVTTLALVALCGCQLPSKKRPDWVKNPQTLYPESKYLVAVGEGDTRRAAENAASGNLSRIFKAQIKSDERLQENTRETLKTIERTVDLTTDINVLSSQTLYNIQYAESWVDEAGRTHAVAYLDRRKTATLYRGMIDQKANRIDFLLTQAGAAKDPIEKYAALRAAAKTAFENRKLLTQLQTIHAPSASAAEPNYELDKVLKLLTDTAQKIRIQIKIKGDTDKRISHTIEELMTSYGFVVAKPAVLNVIGTVSVDNNGRKAQLDFVRYSLNVQVADAAARILLSINESGQEAHNSPAEARTRAFRTLTDSIKQNGTQRLDAFFDSLTPQSADN